MGLTISVSNVNGDVTILTILTFVIKTIIWSRIENKKIYLEMVDEFLTPFVYSDYNLFSFYHFV